MKQVEQYEAHVASGIRLNANESSVNLSETIRNEIAEAMKTLNYNRYPDDEETQLLEAYGKLMNLSVDQLLAGNGSDQMLGLIIGTYLGKDRRLYTLNPDFSMYDYYASTYEAEILKYNVPNSTGAFDVQDFIAQGKAADVNLILFSNPNNPTGHQLTSNEVKEILRAFPEIPVVVDEAYMEFTTDSMIQEVENYPNCLVTRTLSKAFAIAGVRVGFLVGCKERMKQLKAMKVPYALSVSSMAIASIVLAHGEEFLQEAQNTIARRDQLYTELKNFQSVQIYPSSGNYLRGRCATKKELMERLKEAGITIRTYGDDTFRITIGTQAECAAVRDVLTAFEKESV